MTISGTADLGSRNQAAASLLFSPGGRPGESVIRAVAEDDGQFKVSFVPERADDDGLAVTWLELLASGLTFDLLGLSPGPEAASPPDGHGDIPTELQADGLEAVTLIPGPHITTGVAIVPVIRTLAWLAASLARADGVRAVAWHPARSWSAPLDFREAVLNWIEGGVFPALSLTSLSLASDGSMRSEGLALFTGQELRLEPELIGDPAQGAKLAVRLIDHLVERGTLAADDTLIGPDGAPLQLEPSDGGFLVRVWRG